MPSVKPDLVKISLLAAESGVPVSTIKHYIREGLVQPTIKNRNMALYNRGLSARIRAIKELQRNHFLPLRRIVEFFEREGSTIDQDLESSELIARVLMSTSGNESRTRAQLLDSGVLKSHLKWLEAVGFITPKKNEETGEDTFDGDDLELLRTLGAARKAGLTSEMLPIEILQTYLDALRQLIEAELALFRAGVLPRAGESVPELTASAMMLSERLVVLLRRKLLMHALSQQQDE